MLHLQRPGGSTRPCPPNGGIHHFYDDALEQVWLFIVAPLIGGALAAVAHEGLAEPETA